MGSARLISLLNPTSRTACASSIRLRSQRADTVLFHRQLCCASEGRLLPHNTQRQRVIGGLEWRSSRSRLHGSTSIGLLNHVQLPKYRPLTTGPSSTTQKPSPGFFSRFVPVPLKTQPGSGASFRKLVALAKPERKPLAIAIGLLLVSSSVSLSIPFTIGRLIDFFSTSNPVSRSARISSCDPFLTFVPNIANPTGPVLDAGICFITYSLHSWSCC